MHYVAVFVTQYNSSLTSFVPNFRSQVVAEKCLTEKISICIIIGVTEGKIEKLNNEVK